MLLAEGLAFSHGAQPLSRDLSLSCAAGEVTALVGPNGAGKSTLLRALHGEHPLAAGRLSLGGVAYRPATRRAWQRRIGYMPQESRAAAGLSVLETVLLGSVESLAFRLPDAALRRAATLLARFGLIELAGRPLSRISGGQRQLVFFAQALLREPAMLLLDEPVSALDLRHQRELLRALRSLTVERGLVSLVVLHDLNLAARYADRVAVLQDGRLRAVGPPQTVLAAPLLSEVYGVALRVVPDADGHPLIHVPA